MAEYPDAIPEFREQVNIPGQTFDIDKQTTIFAEDFILRSDEIVAIAETLGTNPEGSEDTVKDRLQALEDFVNALVIPPLIPVGGLYFSVNSTNPGTSLGYGTWSAFGAGRVPVGFDSGQTEFDTDEETGGAKTHALVTGELAAHTHSVDNTMSFTQTDGGSNFDPGAIRVGANANRYNASPQNMSDTSGSAGSGDGHNNLQPYIVVRMWKRTA